MILNLKSLPSPVSMLALLLLGTGVATAQAPTPFGRPIERFRGDPKIPLKVFASQATPVQAKTPQLLLPGTKVTVTGSGFRSGARVKFGNADALVNASSIDPMGTWLTAVVPALATSGPVSVLQDGATYPATGTIQIDNWRNVNGFSFGNTGSFQSMVGGWDFNALTAIFGRNETYLGGGPIENPFAWIFLAIANAALQNGQCFGFTVAGLRLQAGQQSFANFSSWNGTDSAVTGPTKDVWHLKGPQMSAGTNSSPSLSSLIHNTHIQQFSFEFLMAMLAYSNLNGNKDVFRNQVRSVLNAGRAGIITINSGAVNHVMQFYNLEEHTDGSFDVWVYDPNVPFEGSEADGSRTRVSRIIVSSAGQFVFNNAVGQNCSGSLSSLRAIPLSAVPLKPTIPLAGILALAFGFGDAAQVTQVTDSTGKKLLGRDGTTNTDPGSRMPGSIAFVPMGGLRSKQEAPLLVLGGKGPHQYTVTGRKGGTYSLQTVGGGFAAKLENLPTSVGMSDEVTIDQGAASVRFKTAALSKQVTLQLHARAADGHMRSAVLATIGHANAPVHLGFDALRDSVVYRHEGQPTTFTLKLSAAGPGNKMETLQTAPATVEKGDQITFRPNWKVLGAGGTMQVQKLGGAVQQKQLK